MKFWEPGNPISLQASCPEHHVPLLLQYDHFTVVAQGFMGVLITYQWQIEGHANGETIAHVILNPLPKKPSHSFQELRNVILRHPKAPANV